MLHPVSVENDVGELFQLQKVESMVMLSFDDLSVWLDTLDFVPHHFLLVVSLE